MSKVTIKPRPGKTDTIPNGRGMPSPRGCLSTIEGGSRMRLANNKALLCLLLAFLLALSAGLAGCGSEESTDAESAAEEEVAAEEPVAEEDGPLVVDFEDEKEGTEIESFIPMVGNWLIVKDGGSVVLKVDGTGWVKGTVREDLKAQVDRSGIGDEFYTNVSTYSDYPFIVAADVDEFTEGEISMDFKTISGLEDQGAGILFDVKPNGDYLTIRANPLESNIVMFEMVAGKRTKLVEVTDIPTPQGEWANIKIVIEGATAKAYLNDELVMETPLKATVSGRVGIWTKADSHVMYDNYTVTAK